MDKRTAEALELSIAHWERNVAAETPGGASVSGSDCALCKEFRRKYAECEGCPVSSATGIGYCDRSPYPDAVELFTIWRESDPVSLFAWRAAAQRELDFLKELRAEEK